MQTAVFGREQLHSFREELLRRKNKTDIVTSTQHIWMDDDGTLTVRDVTGQTNVDHLKMTQWATGQLATHLKIPIDYYRRMDMPDHKYLLAENVNHWLKAETANRLVRIFDNEIIAFLSDRYKAIDNYVVATTAFEVAQEAITAKGHTAQLVKSYIDEKSMSITIHDPEEIYDIGFEGQHDTYHPAVNIRNSEVGARSYIVYATLLRTSCMNSAIFGGENAGFKRRHVGSRLGEGVGDDVWSPETQKIEAELIKSQTADVVRVAFDREIIRLRLAKLKSRKDEPMPPTLTDASKDVLGLTDEESDAIWNRIEANNRYEFIQAVTSLANDYQKENADNPGRGTELQELGGELIQDDNIWDQIEKASKGKGKS